VQASIINKFPHADICISIVWIKKLSGDSEQTAKRLGWTGHVAWDIYLFYEAGVEWANITPQPAYWMHQLKDSWAHKAHFRTGDGLVRELLNAVTKLLDIKNA
jgi:hypothetical protein